MTCLVLAEWLILATTAMRSAIAGGHIEKKLPNGSPIVGQVVTLPASRGKSVEEYLGVPFAEPPVGALRFRAPRAKAPWTEPWNCTTPPKSCMQAPDTYFGDFEGSTMWNPNTPLNEDCLYLNVWVPHKEPGANETYTVLVWILGGGFIAGTTSLKVYDGKILAAEENIIVVSMNYRVTLFGFLYTGREDAPGNAGLLDQQLALLWVRDNIKAFGGDPNDVTIFGESAGAVSVSIHTLVPSNKGLFKRAIVQSGSATAPWAFTAPHILKNRTFMLAEACNCSLIKRKKDNFDLDKAMDCLHKLDAASLLSKEWLTTGYLEFSWSPVVDGQFIVEDPFVSLRRGAMLKVDILAGTVHDEAMYFVVPYLGTMFPTNAIFSQTDFIVSDELFENATKLLLPKHISRNAIAVEAVLHEYKNWSLSASAVSRQSSLDKILGDYMFSCNVIDYADYYSATGANVYLYYFVHQSSQMHWPKWMGVLHGYEIEFNFGLPLIEQLGYTKNEQELSRKIMRYWANFARSGNPNRNPEGATLVNLNEWPLYTQSKMQYINLGAAAPGATTIGSGLRRQQCDFWKKLLPQMLNSLSCEQPRTNSAVKLTQVMLIYSLLSFAVY